MRRLLVALCTLLALALIGPAMVSAQDATPEADAGGTDGTCNEPMSATSCHLARMDSALVSPRR
jgi:hypothetical protein